MFHHNQFLFSDSYINDILPESNLQWRDVLPQAEQFLTWLKSVYQQEWLNFTNYSENQLEEHWFKPIFQQLGHVFEGQAVIPSLEQVGIKKPDYIFFPHETARHESVAYQKTVDYVAQAIAVAEVKRWGTPLSKKMKGGSPNFSDQNPSFQIDYYLNATNFKWGILSNGELWRLVHADTSRKLNVYYEVNLLEILHTGNPKAMLYFVMFFRQQSFMPDDKGQHFLNDVLRSSHQYAVQLEDDLQQNVYYALETLTQGFLDFRANQLTPADVMTIRDNSLYYLYRLLFILYAESRGLLPLSNPIYCQHYSLHQLKAHIAGKVIDVDIPIPDQSTKYWSDIQILFQIINGDNPEFNHAVDMPRYNGGLFSPIMHSFLQEKKVGDNHLTRVIDLLCRRQTERGREFVDYRTLGIRQLGSIYEGLLEFQPQVSLHENKGTTIKLVNEKGERKITGSYYTPQYIVEYIVKETLHPFIEQARTHAKSTRQAHDFADAILKLKILDPAMGSGHFLVEAIDYLAQILTTDPYLETDARQEEDLTYWKRIVTEKCIYGVDKNPLAVELAKLSLWLTTTSPDKPLSFLDHHLKTGDSLVGADVHALDNLPMILLSAKARQKKHAQHKKQVTQYHLFDQRLHEALPNVIKQIFRITHRESDSYDTVKEKETINQQVEALKMPFKQIADFWLDAYFDKQFTIEEYDAYLKDVFRSMSKQETMSCFNPHGTMVRQERFSKTFLVLPTKALRLRDFFHWQLEFPEVFYDEHGKSLHAEGGFDIIFGNPPYIRQERLQTYKPYLHDTYKSHHGVADIYIYFYEQGLNLLKHNGRLGYITSGTYARANFAKSFRTYLPQMAYMESLVDFGENQPFHDAEMVRPSIAILQKGAHHDQFRYMLIKHKQIPKSIKLAMDEHGIDCLTKILHAKEWSFQSVEITQLFNNIYGQGVRLLDFVDGHMYGGIKTGLNDVFYISDEVRNKLIRDDPANSEIIKPLLRGTDMRPWYQKDEGRWLLFTRRGTNIEDYPAIKTYLEQYKKSLTPRPQDWSSKEKWAGRKPGTYQWYEIQDTIGYYEEFDTINIIYPLIGNLPRFSLDEKGYYIGNSGFFIASATYFLLGILQSRVSWFTISQFCQPLRLRGGLWQYNLSRQYVERLPIPDISETEQTPIADFARQITMLAQKRYQLHRRSRHRITSDLGTSDGKLNQKLTAWWGLSFQQFRSQIKRVFKHDIVLRERDDWEEWLKIQQENHEQLTSEIIHLETLLNEAVYDIFNLTHAERKIIEESTMFDYGIV